MSKEKTPSPLRSFQGAKWKGKGLKEGNTRRKTETAYTTIKGRGVTRRRTSVEGKDDHIKLGSQSAVAMEAAKKKNEEGKAASTAKKNKKGQEDRQVLESPAN